MKALKRIRNIKNGLFPNYNSLKNYNYILKATPKKPPAQSKQTALGRAGFCFLKIMRRLKMCRPKGKKPVGFLCDHTE